MYENWNVVAFMAKCRHEEESLSVNKTYIGKKPRKSNPTHYIWLNSFGKVLIKLGKLIEKRFRLQELNTPLVSIEA